MWKVSKRDLKRNKLEISNVIYDQNGWSMMGIKGFHGVAAFVGTFFSISPHPLSWGVEFHTHIQFEEHTGFLFETTCIPCIKQAGFV